MDEIKQELWERFVKPFQERIAQMQLQPLRGVAQPAGRHKRFNSDGEEIDDVIVIDGDDDDEEEEETSRAEQLPSIGLADTTNGFMNVFF